MYPHQLRTITAVALTLFAFVVFAAPAPAEPASSFLTDPYYNQDLRSPDARGAANPRGESVWVRPSQDLRSPDTRDAALISQGLMEQPTTTITVDPTPDPAGPPPSNGFHWLDAAIGAAGALGLTLIATGTTVAVRRRTRRGQPAVA
jgi:hypothetical protein